MRLQSLLHFLTWLDPSFPFPSVSGGLGFSPKCVWISKRYACKTSTASFCSTGLTRFWFILILLSVPVHQVSYKWYGVCLPYWFRYSLFLSLLSHIRLPSGISVKGYGTFFHIPAYLLHQTLPRMVRIQISDRLVHTQVHRFFCNISALLPGFLLLNSTHKPAPVPYAPSPSCIQLDATAFFL